MLNGIELSRVDLNLLTLFEVVLEEGHVGRAAHRLHLTPSAVSHGLGCLRRLLNDPLFLRTPKGVVPTARASELAAPIADILSRVRGVMAMAEPFVPERSARRFRIGAPDGVSAVLLPPLLALLGQEAPRVALGIRQLLPEPGEIAPERAWASALAELEARAIDLAILPVAEVPPRFHARAVYEEDFVVALRQDHRLAKSMGIERYCDAQHLVVSHTGDAWGFVDRLLAEQGRSRQVALTVPNFLFALATLAETNLVSALPRRLVQLHGPRFGVVAVRPPLDLGRFHLQAVAPQAAMLDAGLAWMMEQVARCAPPATPARRRSAARAG